MAVQEDRLENTLRLISAQRDDLRRALSLLLKDYRVMVELLLQNEEPDEVEAGEIHRAIIDAEAALMRVSGGCGDGAGSPEPPAEVLECAHVGPGERLVLRVSPDVTNEEMEWMSQHAIAAGWSNESLLIV